MSIFVGEETFPIRIHYVVNYDDETNVVTGVRICQPDVEGAQELVCDCVGRDWETMSEVVEQSSVINHVSKRAMFRIKVLCQQIVLNFVRAWNIKDEHGKMVPILPSTVAPLRYEIPRAIAKEWLRKTGSKVRVD